MPFITGAELKVFRADAREVAGKNFYTLYCVTNKFQGLSQLKMPKRSGIGWSRPFVHQQLITWLLEVITQCGPLLSMVLLDV